MPRLCSSSGWPMPDNSRSCGELIEPALTIDFPPGAGLALLAVDGVAHADAALALDQQAFGQRIGLDRQVRAGRARGRGSRTRCSCGGHCGWSPGSCRCRPAARRYSRLRVGDADFAGGLDQRVVERAGFVAFGDLQRAAAAAVFVVRRRPGSFPCRGRSAAPRDSSSRDCRAAPRCRSPATGRARRPCR